MVRYMENVENGPGLSGTIEIKKADGSVIKLKLLPQGNSKENLGEKQNGDTSTSDSHSESDC